MLLPRRLLPQRTRFNRKPLGCIVTPEHGSGEQHRQTRYGNPRADQVKPLPAGAQLLPMGAGAGLLGGKHRDGQLVHGPGPLVVRHVGRLRAGNRNRDSYLPCALRSAIKRFV